MRQWETLPKNLSLTVAGDVRLATVTYDDDQIWEVNMGEATRPALALQTHYGGRVGLASIVPLWTMMDGVIYEANAYHTPLRLVSFSASYQHIAGQIVAGLSLDVHIWAIDSHNLGVLYQLKNQREEAISFRAELFGHVGASGAELPIGIITLSDRGHGLYLGDIGGGHAVVMMDGGHASEGQNGRIGVDVQLKAGESRAITWVHSAEKSVRESIRIGRIWLGRDWLSYFKQISWLDKAIPRFQTGKPLYDLILAIGGVRLVQSLMPIKGDMHLVATRQASEGYRPSTRKHHQGRSWQGYDAYLLWQTARSLVEIAPDKASTMLDGFLRLQNEQGGIYLPAHPSSPVRTPLLCAPLLAQIAQRLILDGHIKEWERLYTPLRRFFDHWMGQDADGDGIPEWQHERQMNYVGFPTFGVSQTWGQGLDVRYVESPDLIAYLMAEVEALKVMAEALKKKADIKALDKTLKTLAQALDMMWQEAHFAYRDRDTHLSTAGDMVLMDGQADKVHHLNYTFDTPQRIMVVVRGGATHEPNVILTIKGLDADGQEVTLTVKREDFTWQYRRGIYTAQTVFSVLEEVHCEGLSRVYKVDVFTPDLKRVDINGILPLIVAGLSTKQRQVLVNWLKDEEHFLRPNGLTLVTGQDSKFDGSNAEGAGGIWLYWIVRLCEALLKEGEDKLAVDIVKRVLELQSRLITETNSKLNLGQFYHSDDTTAYGEAYHLAGLLPTSLMMSLMGVRILDEGQTVVISPEFAWNRSIAVQQYGVSIRRTRKRLVVQFASGERVTQDAPETTLVLTDSAPSAVRPDFDLPTPPKRTTEPVEKAEERIVIEVEVDEE